MPSLFNRNIPDEAHTQMRALARHRIQVFAFTPGNGWVIVTENGKLFARNIPDECYKKLKEYLRGGHRVVCVAFPNPGGNRWVIVTNKTFFARNIPDECYEQMKKYAASSHKIAWIAFPRGGGNRWLILTNRGFFARNIADECYQILRNLRQGVRKIGRVAFTPSGGWLVTAEDYFFARNIPDECFQKLRDFDRNKWLIRNVAFSPRNGGWSILANDKYATRPTDLARTAENRTVRVNNKWQSVWEVMRARKVPGVALAVVRGNSLDWSAGYGHLRSGKDPASHPESVFQAASVSKFMTAIGILRMAHLNLLGLDDNILNSLGWTLPRRSCVAQVTSLSVRQLLTHNGGIVGRNTTTPADECSGFQTGGGGFAGYENKKGVKVPTLLQVLNGTDSIVNSPKTEFTHAPGTRYSYSGAGFAVIQRLMERTIGRTSFNSWFQENVFEPLGMTSSTFVLGPPASFMASSNVAAGHGSSGGIISGERNRYPESTAAGLYTTPIDLSSAVIMLNRGGMAGRRRFLRAGLVTDMLSGQPVGTTTGLGCGFSGSGNSRRYSHGGSNRGFRCTVQGFAGRDAGVIVMTNGSDDDLPGDFARAVARVSGW